MTASRSPTEENDLYYIEPCNPELEPLIVHKTSLYMWRRYLTSNGMYDRDFVALVWSYRRECTFSSLVLNV